MKDRTVADDKIIEIKDFKKINGEIIRIKVARSKKKKKNKKDKDIKPDDALSDLDYTDENMDFEDEFIDLLEENEILQAELFKERIRRQTIEKLLNKLLKQQASKVKDND